MVLLLLCIASVLLAAGCEGEPKTRGDLAPAAALRAAFPEQAAGVLRGGEGLVASGGGFAPALAGDPAGEATRRGGLSIELPARGEDAVRLRLPGRLDLSVREIGLSGEGSLVEGAVAYARPGGRSFWSATESGYEEWLHVEAGVATDREPVAAWEVEGAAVREKDGALEIVGADGAVRVHVTAPSAFAAGGRAVPARLAARGSRIELWTGEANGEELLIDPVWSTLPPLAGVRVYHSATLLSNGKVLVVGGKTAAGTPLATAELYDPATSAWTAAHSLGYARYMHTATLLSNGKVLVAGGYGSSGYELHAELYDPAQDTWSAAGTLSSPGRYGHVAALLGNGKVLVAGGYGGAYLASAERWDPATNLWTSAGSMPGNGRMSHTATLLPSNGKVLVTGGYNPTDGYLNTAALYNPTTNAWAASAHTMAFSRAYHATVLLQNNKALVTGGYGSSGGSNAYLITAETYDPGTDTWTSTAVMNGTTGRHTATLLGDGKVLVVGGLSSTYNSLTQQYDPAAGTWSNTQAWLNTSRAYHTATLLGDGKVLVVGGYNGSYLSSAELFDPAANTWAPASAMSLNRWDHTATSLSTGKVWVAGGYNGVLGYLSTTASYDPAPDSWASKAAMSAVRSQHTATPLSNDQVLVAGGTSGSSLQTALVYDGPSNSYVASVGSMQESRYAHAATRLPDGSVLVTGGYSSGLGYRGTTETYDPAAKAWTARPSMSAARSYHTATLLGSGLVLVAGGYGGGAPLASAELYDPVNHTWTTVGSLHTARYRHTATLLPDGRVLVAGGYNAGSLGSAEIYDPATQAWTWSTIPSMGTSRYLHTATRLDNGWVLFAGGYNTSAGAVASAEIYDPSANAWLAAAPMGAARYRHAAALLQDGRVLITGGYNLSTAEIYTPVVPSDDNPCSVDAWSPGLGQVTHAPAPAGTVCRPSAGPCDAAETCDGTSTACPADASAADGTACDDGDACTQTDTCQAGACTGSSPVVCTALDQCHVAGTCDPATGLCSSPPKLDGLSCDDGDPDTYGDVCAGGACAGVDHCAGVVCTALDPCHVAGTCVDHATGACSNPVRPDGTACDDGNPSTTGDVCTGGVCGGTDACSGTCAAANGTAACVNGACAITSCASGYADCDGVYANGCEANLSTSAASCGSCGHACAAATACAAAETCENKVCKVTPHKVEDGNPCSADACDPATGMSHTALPDGAPCWDGTEKRTCQGGACSGGTSFTAPTLYADPRHQSPVRGDPGDLLLLPGADFDLTGTVVVYKAVGDTTQPPSPPSTMPTTQTATEGVIDGAAFPNLWRGDNGLRVALPAVLTAGQSYALWAVTPDASGAPHHSNPVLINDARPMWVSPGPRVTSPGNTSYSWVYAGEDRPGTGRAVKIVGRNLQPVPGHSTQVRFTTSAANPGCTPASCQAAGGQCQGSACVITLSAASTAVSRYAAQVTLPSPMPLVNGEATDYDIAVSRDNGVSWVPVPTGLTVLPDPAAPVTFRPNDFGDVDVDCDPCNVADHTLCIARAIHAAARHVTPLVPVECTGDQDCATGQICKGDGLCGNVAATVVFDRGACGTGTWVLDSCGPYGSPLMDDYFQDPLHGGETDPYAACYAFYGIQVPQGVSLAGEPGATWPTIETAQGFDQPPFDYWASVNGPTWDPGDGRQYLFELLGDNVVEGLRFTDSYQGSFPGPGSLSLLPAGHDIAITDNFFDGTYTGVGARGEAVPYLPDGSRGFSGVVVTHNTFANWFGGFGGDHEEEAVISDNVFWPGGAPAPIAAGVRGARHLDMSSNTVDGDVTAYSEPYGLYGWRAGFFFPTFRPQEDVLVAGNTFKCVGTRPGYDGEAISTDSNGGGSLLRWTEEVQAASSAPGTPTTSQVTTPWPSAAYWVTPTDAGKLVGSWLRVMYGVGLGQARKITGVATTATTITYTVSPAFDVLPVAGSRVGAGSQIWQFDIVDNHVDNGCPEIPRAPVDLFAQLLAGQGASALHYTSTGLIGLYSTSVDVAMDSNELTDTAGLDVYVQYWDKLTTDANGVHGVTYQTPQYFIDVRDNHVTGKLGGAGNTYNTFGSGIALYGISTTSIDGVPQDNPNLPGFGVSVSHNVLSDAAMKYPAWSVNQTAGIGIVLQNPSIESLSPAYVDTLIFANDVSRSANGGPPACTDGTQAPPYSGSYDSAISNGSAFTTAGMANYPQGTVLCGNTSSNFGCTGTDWPNPAGASTMSTCQ